MILSPSEICSACILIAIVLMEDIKSYCVAFLTTELPAKITIAQSKDVYSVL